mmetsp:Transcript_33325/g.105596  ORF Transcript_33325/g.105596 Transcript_33325/m.105596 type:complete len:109 (-) Transcript_33325:111-437(-)
MLRPKASFFTSGEELEEGRGLLLLGLLWLGEHLLRARARLAGAERERLSEAAFREWLRDFEGAASPAASPNTIQARPDRRAPAPGRAPLPRRRAPRQGASRLRCSSRL